MDNNRNLFLALFLSFLVMAGWYFFFAGPQMRAEQAKQAHQAALQHSAAQTAATTTSTVRARRWRSPRPPNSHAPTP